MSVDLNYSNRTSQLISINTEIVQSCLLLNFANQEQHEIWHHVIQGTAEAARGISFQGFLKLKEKEKLLPTFETFQSSATEQRQISKCSPKLSSWNYTSSWGNLPIRESSCIMNWGVTLNVHADTIVLYYGLRHPNQLGQISLIGQISLVLIDLMHRTLACSEKATFISIKSVVLRYGWTHPTSGWDQMHTSLTLLHSQAFYPHVLLPLLLKVQDAKLLHGGLSAPIIESDGPQYSEKQNTPTSCRPVTLAQLYLKSTLQDKLLDICHRLSLYSQAVVTG